MNRLTEITTEKDGINLSKRHKKQDNIWEQQFRSMESPPQPMGNPAALPSDEELACAWREGLTQAQAKMTHLLGKGNTTILYSLF